MPITIKKGATPVSDESERRARERARQDWEDRRDAREAREAPSPEQIKAALMRMKSQADMRFELTVGGTWRSVYLIQQTPMPGQGKNDREVMDNTVIFFKPELVFSDAYMPTFPGSICMTWEGAKKGVCTWLTEKGSKNIQFRCSTETAEAWLAEKFAMAAGMKYRSHSIVSPDKLVYTKEA